MRDYAALERSDPRTRYDYRDKDPIDDLLLALSLLQRGWNDRTMRRLIAYSLQLEQPYIEVMICNGGYTREEHSHSEYYPVTRELVCSMREKGLVCGTPHWGYTDEGNMRLTERGGQVCNDLATKFEEEVKEFLAREHPNEQYVCETARADLGSMRFRQGFEDFFLSIRINAARDEVRRTRGIYSLVRKETKNAA